MSLKWSDISRQGIAKYNPAALEAWNDGVTQVAAFIGASHILGGDYEARARTDTSTTQTYTPTRQAQTNNGSGANSTYTTQLTTNDGSSSSSSIDANNPSAGGDTNTQSGSNTAESKASEQSDPSLLDANSTNPTRVSGGTVPLTTTGIFQPTPIRLTSTSSGITPATQGAGTLPPVMPTGVTFGATPTTTVPALMHGGYTIDGQYLSSGTDEEQDLISRADAKLKYKLNLDRSFINRLTGIEEEASDRTRRMVLFKIMKDSLKNHSYLLAGIAIGDCRGIWTKVNTTGISTSNQIMQQLLGKLVTYHKSKSISFTEWTRTLNDLFVQLDQLGAHFSESVQKAYLISLMRNDSRYRRALERLDESPKFSLGYCYILLSQRATVIEDMIAGPKPTHEINNTSGYPPSNSSSNGGGKNNTKRMQNSSRDICFRFAVLGTCPDGDTCSRAHVANANVPKADRERILKKNSRPQQPSKYPPKRGVTDGGQNRQKRPAATAACFQFAEKGSCTFGERCRFEHAREMNSVQFYEPVEMNMNISSSPDTGSYLPPPPEHHRFIGDEALLLNSS